MSDALVTVDEQGLIESFNAAASAVFGYSAEQAIGRSVNLLMPPRHRELHDGYMAHYRENGRGALDRAHPRTAGAAPGWQPVPMTITLSRLERAGRITFIGLMTDITSRLKAEEAIHRLAYYDPLTEVAQPATAARPPQARCGRGGRSGQAGALMFLDLDHFKQVNDSLGHVAGDDLLRQVAARLLGHVREGDTVARVGGDEFVLVLEALGTEENDAVAHAALVANKLLAALGQPYSIDGRAVTCTPSLGIAMLVPDQDDLEALIKQADAAMYQAKAAGRNRARFFDPATQAAVLERTALIDALREGLARQEFLLHYQVQVDGSGRATGAEALVRWNHPTRGLVSPAQFIPLAEETGLILPLGGWVLQAACAQLAAWAPDARTARWSLAVNVSSLQFAQPDFVDTVAQALQQSGARGATCSSSS